MKEQFYLYSVDTKAFYTKEEQSIDKQKYESIKEVKHICQSTIDKIRLTSDNKKITNHVIENYIKTD